MITYEIIEFIKTKLEEGKDIPSDLLYGYNIIIDPYCDLSRFVPLILIEDAGKEYLPSEYGDPVAIDQKLTLTIFESAQKESFDVYKRKINETEAKLITKLMSIDDIKVRRICPTESSQNEVFLGSLKATGLVLEVKVRTNWEE